MAERKWSSPRLFALYEGDRVAAKRLERRARICVGYLFDQLRPGQTYRTQTWNYEDGSRIKAYVWRDVLGERARVEIFAPAILTEEFPEFFIMESGLLVVPTLYELEANPSTPGTLIPLQPQQDLVLLEEDQLLDQFQGSRIFQYRDYLQDSLESLSLAPDTSLTKKWLIYMIRPYELTGKFALLAKTHLMGIKGEVDSQIMYWLLSVRWFSLAPLDEVAKRSFFLYTESVGNYVLVYIADDEVRIRKVRPREKYRVLANNLLSILTSTEITLTDAEAQRYEAYLLATCDFVGDWYTVANVEIEGQTLKYGWKPTWGGSKAAIVTLEKNRINEADELLPIIARLYAITLTPSSEEDYDPALPYSSTNVPFSVSFTTVEEKEWTPRFNTDIIWIPSNALSASDFWYPRGCDKGFNTDISSDNVPVYCWYDYQNRLVRVNHSLNLDDNITTPYSGWQDWQDSIVWCANESSVIFPRYEWTQGGKSGYFSVSVGVSDEAPGLYADPLLLGSDFDCRVGGVSAAMYERRDYTWLKKDESICSSGWCVSSNETLGINGAESCGWSGWTPCSGNRDPGCINIGDVKIDVYAATTEVYNETRTATLNAISCKPALVISSGNAESAFLIGEERITGTINYQYDGYRSIVKNVHQCSGLEANTQFFFNIPVGGYGAGCAGLSDGYNLPGDNFEGPLTDITIKRCYADKWGQVNFSNLLAERDYPEDVLTPNGFYLLFNNPVCSDPAQFVGYFLTLAGTEGLKFYQRNPGSLTFQDFGSNCGADWDFTHLQLFAGWQ